MKYCVWWNVVIDRWVVAISALYHLLCIRTNSWDHCKSVSTCDKNATKLQDRLKPRWQTRSGRYASQTELVLFKALEDKRRCYRRNRAHSIMQERILYEWDEMQADCKTYGYRFIGKDQLNQFRNLVLTTSSFSWTTSMLYYWSDPERASHKCYVQWTCLWLIMCHTSSR